MNAQIKDLLQRMTHQDGPEVRSSADSRSLNAYREAERITDYVILSEAKAAVVPEKNKKIRAALYFLIAKVAVNLRHSDTSDFLIEQLRRETDKYVLKGLLDRIAELPKSEGTDLQPILDRLEDPRWLVRFSAIQALKLAVSPNAELALVDLLERSTDPYDINFANVTLNQIGSLQSIPALERHLSSRKRDMKDSAQLAIQTIRERHEGQKIVAENRP
jgi:HEAT repeat protein